MTRTHFLVGLVVFGLTTGCNQHAPRDSSHASRAPSQPAAASDSLTLSGRLIDLTHPFDQSTIYWPTEPGFQLQRGAWGVTERGYFYAANRFQAPEHGGTHLDAPIHFYQDRQTIDQIPLDRLVGPGAVVDVSQSCRTNRDYLIQLQDLRDWEESHQQTLADKIVLLRTGWSRHWPDRKAYLGTSETGPAAVEQLHFPGLDPQAARWLAESRGVRAVGIDTASIDHGPSRDFGSHVNLFQHNVPAIENLASLDQLPAHGFVVVALPMKIAQGTGAPVRVVAVVERMKAEG